MKDLKILSAPGGIDVVSKERRLQPGCVRVAENVVLEDDRIGLRPGTELAVSLAGAHSGWSDGDFTLLGAGGALYMLDGDDDEFVTTSLASGLGPGPWRFDEYERGGDVYVATANTLLRVARDGTVTIPGVASMIGFAPTLTPAAGGLVAGIYGVAVSAVSASGEESGLSDIAWIELTTAAGIALTLPTAPTGVIGFRVYRTTQNGDELYHAMDVGLVSSATIAGGDVGKQEMGWPLDQMPTGSNVKAYKGRLYVSVGPCLIFSEPIRPGVYDPRKNVLWFGSDITMHQPVEGGIFVGTEDTIYFLEGDRPFAFQRKVVASNGAIKHSESRVPATALEARLIDTTKECAVWLSPLGYQIGLPGGTVLTPQSKKIALSGVERAPTLAFTLDDGVKQLVSAVETMTLGNGGATDSTP